MGLMGLVIDVSQKCPNSKYKLGSNEKCLSKQNMTPGMSEREETKSPTVSQGTVLLSGLLDLSLSWELLGRI
jgi:hypothetical protein